ncbi:hypothetical protein BDR06DRAFT_125278 [Suillus hirtellus]|nr:hypothetical protein BDR06DRAFT_125278 [Suillus hirtellus]
MIAVTRDTSSIASANSRRLWALLHHTQLVRIRFCRAPHVRHVDVPEHADRTTSNLYHAVVWNTQFYKFFFLNHLRLQNSPKKMTTMMLIFTMLIFGRLMRSRTSMRCSHTPLIIFFCMSFIMYCLSTHYMHSLYSLRHNVLFVLPTTNHTHSFYSLWHNTFLVRSHYYNHCYRSSDHDHDHGHLVIRYMYALVGWV